MDYLQRHIEFQQELGHNTIREGDLIFREYNQIIIPLGPVIQSRPDIFPDLNRVLKNLRGKLVWWSYADENAKDDGWYAVIKSKHFEIEQYPSTNLRNQVRKGLKNCEVRKVDASWLAQNGYPVFRAAVEKYAKEQGENEELNFTTKLTKACLFQDIIEYWGIFYGQKLIGYAEIYLYGHLEANISQIKVDPNYQALYPVYALVHKLSEVYLKENHINYLSDGYRNLLHDSGVQGFLIQKFGFFQSKLNFHMAIRFPFNLLIKLIYPFRRIIPSNSIKAVIKLIEIYKSQK